MRTVIDIALRTVVNGVALWVASLLVAGVRFGPTVNANLGAQSETTRTVITVALVALVFGAANALIKPVLKTLATPLIWLTLGLFTLVVNRSDAPAQLIARHWKIEDEQGPQDEVRGLGVVGQQPLLRPGERFEYSSGCRLRSDTGSMEGSYRFVTEVGEAFDVPIPRFVMHAAQGGGHRVLH